MLMLETILRKLEFIKPNDNVTILDLTKSSLEYNIDVPITTYTVVTNEFVMRSDLISESVYGVENKLDYILKYNGVSNPLTIYKGQVLYIPDETAMSQVFKTPNQEVTPVTLEQLIVAPKTKKDATRLDLLKKKAQMDIILPPNINKDGENNIEITNEKILLGGSVTNNSANCPDNISRARLKQSILNKKIFG